MSGLIVEFLEFLKEYKVVALAVAFIIGVAATSLVKYYHAFRGSAGAFR